MKDLHGLSKTCKGFKKRQVTSIVNEGHPSRSFSEDSSALAEARLDDAIGSSRDEQLEGLYAQLGRVLFERTKGVEEYYLLAPELFLAIERIDSEM